MKVWIDQDLCTGDGLCEEICPENLGRFSWRRGHWRLCRLPAGLRALCSASGLV